jgi:hypothetical protein
MNNKYIRGNNYFNYILVAIITLYPAFLSVYMYGVDGVISFFEADTFYYLNVLKRSISLDYYTYDGIYPTNGFHPLWQYLITGISKFFNINTLDGLIYTVFIISNIFVAIGSILIFSVIKNITSSAILAFLGTVPGFYYLLFGYIHSSYNSTWSYINGMESPISFLFLSIILYLLFNKKYLENTKASQYVILGILLSFLILSRLDDIFIMLSFTVYLLFSLRKSHYIKASLVGFIPLIAIICYMYFSYSYSGLLIPISGTEKFGLSLSNIIKLIDLIYPHFMMVSSSVDYSVWAELSQRQMQMIVPLMLAIILYIYVYKKKVRTNIDKVLLLLASYVVIKAIYNLFFVSMWHQGHWYYTNSIVISSIIIAYFISEFISLKKNTITVSIVITLYIIIMANSFVSNKTEIRHNNVYKVFYDQKDEIQSILNENNVTGIVELDDGIVGYSLENPTINAFGFSLDKDAMKNKKEGKLFDVAINRNYNGFASLTYMSGFTNDMINDNVKLNKYIKSLPWMKEQNLSKYNFRFIYKDEKSGATFIKFEKFE